ncbi:uncharacterized protein LOC117750024 [Cyclopterus lumpus]|uniref:uncharacterized protein LOC117750024 n=1 Tax=Cyclopterus lumpus TaxID=8103 RepID=UPI0014868A6A|nr:uncharacterized protein LOC117750024 [Cyclopterus lumpus]
MASSETSRPTLRQGARVVPPDSSVSVEEVLSGSSSTTRVTVSGVPPFIPNELLEVQLRRSSKVRKPWPWTRLTGQRTLLSPEDEDSLVEYCLYSAGPCLPFIPTSPFPSLPAEEHCHLLPSPEPSTSAAGCDQRPSSPSHSFQPAETRPSSSSSSSAGPTTSTGHTPEDMDTVWECGRCKEPDPPESSEGLVSWVQGDRCHTWYHTTCGLGRGAG